MRKLLIITALMLLLPACQSNTISPDGAKYDIAVPFGTEANKPSYQYARHVEPSTDYALQQRIINALLDYKTIGKVPGATGRPNLMTLKLVHDDSVRLEHFKWSQKHQPTSTEVKDAECMIYAEYKVLRASGWAADDLNIYVGDWQVNPWGDTRYTYVDKDWGQFRTLVLVARVGSQYYALDFMDGTMPEAYQYFVNFKPIARFNENGASR